MALSPPLTLPYIFVNGTIIDAGQVNADFAALLGSLNGNVRNAITQSTTFYVAPNGADIPGNGLTPTTPAQTITYIYQLLQGAYAFASPNAVATIQLAQGSYGHAVINGHIPGQYGQVALVINGDTNNPGSYVLSQGLSVNHGGQVIVQGVTFANPTGDGIYANNGAFVEFTSVVFQACQYSHIEAQAGGVVRSSGNYTIAGGGSSHWAATGSGSGIWIYGNQALGQRPPVQGPVITISGTPAFSNTFAWVGGCASVEIISTTTFPGAANATGKQYDVHNNAVIVTGTAGAMMLPGNAPGEVSTGGVYN